MPKPGLAHYLRYICQRWDFCIAYSASFIGKASQWPAFPFVFKSTLLPSLAHIRLQRYMIADKSHELRALHMQSIIMLILTIINIYTWVIIAMVIASWLFAFNIVNPNNQFVRQVQYFLLRLTEPVLAPIRRILPDLGGIDLSPIVLLLGLQFLRNLIIEYSM